MSCSIYRLAPKSRASCPPGAVTLAGRTKAQTYACVWPRARARARATAPDAPPPPARSDIEAMLAKFLAKYPLDAVGRMATLYSFLHANFPRMNFVGFYVVPAAGAAELTVGPYQGEVLACGTIAFGKGVCGTAAAAGAPQLVADVAAIENYIACDDETKSELVLPVFGRNYHNEPEAPAGAPRKLIGVLDIDGDVVGAFDDADVAALTRILGTLF